MARHFIGVAFLIIALAAQAEELSPQATAELVATAIAQGEFVKAADRLHYPPNYTPEQRSEDVKSVSTSLRLIAADFGAPQSLRSTKESPSVFEVAAGGGDAPYWRSLGTLSAHDVVFSATFEKVGPGYLIVRFVKSSTMASPVIHRVSYCLPISGTSKDLVIQTMKRLFQSKGIPLPPNIDSLLREALTPVETAP